MDMVERKNVVIKGTIRVIFVGLEVLFFILMGVVDTLTYKNSKIA